MSLSLRSILLLGLPLLSAALAPSRNAGDAFDTAVTDEWKEILRELPGDSIEAALGHHLTPKYREGVFEDGHSAMDAVHSDDPELASKLVDLAKQDAEVKDYLRKRQNNSTGEVTTTTTIPPTPITSIGATTTTTQGESTPGGGSDTTSASPSSGQSSASEVSSTSVPSTLSTSPSVEQTSIPEESATPSSSVVESSSVITQDGQTTTIITSIILPASNPTSVDEPPSTADSSSASPSSAVPSSSSSSSAQEQGSPSPSVSSSNAGPTSEISSSNSSPVNSAPSSSDDSPAPTGSTQSGVLIPVEVTTTTDGSAIVSSSNAFETSAPTSVAVEVTSTNDQGQAFVTTSNAPAAIMTFANAQGDVRTTTVPLTSVAVAPGGGIVDGPTVTSLDASGYAYVLTSPTPGGVYTVTDARGLVVTVTYRPHRSTVNQLQLQTTTLPNGMRSVITSFEVVGAPTSAPGPAASPTSGDEPNLQSGAAMSSSWYAAEIALVLGAAIGVAGIVL